MNRELKRLSTVVVAMFLAMFVSSSFIQVIYVDDLRNNAKNTRAIYDSFNVERGPILVADQAIVDSVPVDNFYAFQRQYHDGELYAPITGYYTLYHGSTGLEEQLNSYLNATDSGRFLDRIMEIISGQPLQGATVETTIDPKAQQAAWDAIGNRKGAAVAYDPKTGKILAMVSKPSFDPNLLANLTSSEVVSAYDALADDPNRPLVNRAIAGDLYWPGSIYKTIVMAAALSNGYTPDSTFENKESIRLPGSSYEVRNANRSTCGSGDEVTLKEAFRLSCNVPFVELGLELGAETLRQTSENFGFNQTLSVPLTVTPSSFPEELDDAQLGLVSFGQYDVKVTPMLMAMVAGAIANDGVQMKPYLVDRIYSPSLTLLNKAEEEVLSRPLEPEAAETLTKLMVNNVENGIASGAKVPGIDVAGKTGTAETSRANIQHLWFHGFAPADDPKIAVTVIIEHDIEAQPHETSNSLPAPMAAKIMEAVLKE